MTTVTETRESEWDKDTRDAAIALHEDEQDRCTLCGNPRSICSDPDTAPAAVHRTRCWTTAYYEVAKRNRDSEAEQFAKFHPNKGGVQPQDGETLRMSDTDYPLSPLVDKYLKPALKAADKEGEVTP